MKKLLAIVLSIAMLACFAVVASAENEVVTLTVSKANIAEDGTAILNIDGTVADGENVGSLQFVVKYDAEKLTLVSQDPDDDTADYAIMGFDSNLPKGYMLESKADENGLKAAVITTKGITKNGTWFTVKFKVTDKAAAGEEIAVSLEEVDASKNLEKGTEPITAAATAGAVVNAVATPVSSEEEPPASSEDNTPSTDSKDEVESKGDTKTDDGKKDVPKTGDNSVVFFAVALCVAAAAAFVVTKKVND